MDYLIAFAAGSLVTGLSGFWLLRIYAALVDAEKIQELKREAEDDYPFPFEKD